MSEIGEVEKEALVEAQMSQEVPTLTDAPAEGAADKPEVQPEAEDVDSTEAEQGAEFGTQYFIPIMVNPTIEDRFEFFSRYIMLDRCTTGNALKHLCQTIEHQLAGIHWLAEITENIPLVDLDITQNRIRYLVEVIDVKTIERGSLGYELLAQCKFIKLLDFYDDNEFIQQNPNDFHLHMKQFLRKNTHVADITDLTPIEISEKPDQLTEDASYIHQTKNIAELVDNFSFYLHRIHRHYDFSDDNENIPFGTTLKSRLGIIEQLSNRKIPAGTRQRYNRVRTKYAEKLDQIDELENDYYDIYEFLNSSEAQDDGLMKVQAARGKLEKLRREIIHYHEERDMLADLLANWESFGLSCNGPRWPKRLRVANGRRRSDRKIAHISSGPINLQFLSQISSDPEIEFLTHQSMDEALQAIHEGETMYVRDMMGQQTRTGLHNLNESHIAIEGIGPSPLIAAPPGDDIFVNVSGQDVVLRNLSLVADDNSDGILRVETGGHAVLENCMLYCQGGAGITVCPGAKLTMHNCEILDAELTAGVTQEPSGETSLTDVRFTKCVAGIEVQTLPKNQLPKISGCVFPADLPYHVVVNQIERRYDQANSEVEPVIYRPRSELRPEQESEPVEQQSDAEAPIEEPPTSEEPTKDPLAEVQDSGAGGEQVQHQKKEMPLETILEMQPLGDIDALMEETRRRFAGANVDVEDGIENLTYRMVLI